MTLDILPVVNRRALPRLDGYEVVYVGRPSPFGNPFPVDAHRSRRQAIAMRRGESRDEALRPAFYGEVLTARDGFEGTRAAHARRLGISRQAIDHRIKSGWDPHDAISLPREG